MPEAGTPSHPNANAGGPDYEAFLERLRGYERLEPSARSRGPEKLDGVRRIAEALGHPERAFRVVHVAGTNGKGLTCAMIARLLGDAGQACGLYTSPHVVDVRERIAFTGPGAASGTADGDTAGGDTAGGDTAGGDTAGGDTAEGGTALIAPAAFARAGHRVLDQADALADTVHFSYFDLLTLTALVAFRAAGVAWAVLETGLGGRSDATNITPKVLCVLTRIGLDHLHVLGGDLQTIAGEKLGIVVPGTPTVLAAQPEALTGWLDARLAELDAPLHRAEAFQPERLEGGRKVRGRVGSRPEGMAGSGAEIGADRGAGTGVADEAVLDWPPEAPPLSAPRLACAGAALAAVEVLLGAPPEGTAGRLRRLRTALETTLPGRLERRIDQPVPGKDGGRWPLVVLDGGHNADALAALEGQLAAWDVTGCTLLLALQRDKLVEPLRAPLRRLLARAARVLILEPQTIRAPSVEDLRDFLAPLLPGGVSPEPSPDAAAALNAAARDAEKPLVVAGSLWTVGDVLRLLDGGPEV